VASPFIIQSDDPENKIIKPAIDGVKNVMEACARVGTVKKMILTSSGTTLFYGTQKSIITEDDWSDEIFLRNSKLFYPLSKTLAEKTAWKLSEQYRDKFELVVAIPCFTLGPSLSPVVNTSVGTLLSYMKGEKDKIMNAHTVVVDVRDVARGHLVAYEKDIKGRFIICIGPMSFEEMLIEMKKISPNAKIPTEVDNSRATNRIVIDNKKSLDNGIIYTPIEQSFRDTLDSLVKFGHYVNE